MLLTAESLPSCWLPVSAGNEGSRVKTPHQIRVNASLVSCTSQRRTREAANPRASRRVRPGESARLDRRLRPSRPAGSCERLVR